MSKPIFTIAEMEKELSVLREVYPRGLPTLDVAVHVRDMVERKLRAYDLEGVLAEAVIWSEKTFPQSTNNSVTTHLFREWKELVNSNFTDSSEFADVVLLMNHLAFKKGFTLAEALREKFEVNKKRSWGEVDAEGVVEHIRDDVRQGHPVVEVDDDGVRTGREGRLADHFGGAKWTEVPIPPETDKSTVHFMKLDANGNPYGVGSSPEKSFEGLGMETFAPPINPHWRAIVKEGMVVFEKMVFQNVSGGEHDWRELNPRLDSFRDNADAVICRKLQELADIGCTLPVEVSAAVTFDGKLYDPILNERWESVVGIEKGKSTGQMGRVRRYRTGGKEYASPVEWESNIIRE